MLLAHGEIPAGVAGTVVGGQGLPGVRDSGVLVEGERIAAVGEYARLRADHPAADEIGSADHLLLPGLVDAHDHARGLGHVQGGVADGPLETWVLLLEDCPDIGPYLSALWSGILLVESGVTTVMHDYIPSAHAGLADGVRAALRAYDELGLRVGLGVPFFDQNALSLDDDAFLAGLPPDLAPPARAWTTGRAGVPAREYETIVADLARAVRAEHPRARLLVSPAGPWRCSDAMLARLTIVARDHGLGRHLHLLETRYQRALGARIYDGRTLVERLADLEALGPDLTCAHGVWLTEGDITLLADAGCCLAHNPSSNLRLRSGIAPVPAMLAAGLTVGLGLDGIALDDDQDFLREMRLCATLQACPGIGAPGVGPAQVLRMATADGARAVLGADDPPGRLEPGAPADLTLVRQERMRAPFTHPRLDTLELLLRRGTAMDVDSVIVAGRVVMRERKLTGVDRADVAARVAEAAERALRDTPDPPPWRDALLEQVRRFYQGWAEPPTAPYCARDSAS